MDTRYYPLINKALTFFRLKEDTIIHPENSFTRPFITIAREPGSGGAPIAEAVAQKLDFELVNEQIIDKIAKSTKRRRAIIKAIDEKNRSKIEDIVHSVLNSEYIDDSAYITELIKVILAYAYQGKCVILGRGANFITPFAKGLHVNITAPYKVRVQRAIDYEGHNMAKAKEVIAKVEKERTEFVKQYFKKNPKKANSYDLTINTTYLQFDQTRDIIIEAFYQKFKHSISR